jgi:hypothetical protein
MQKHLEILGRSVRDTVTGFEGVAESVCFDLYGCVQILVRPGLDKKEGKLKEPGWFDEKRLVKVGKKRVMSAPTFETVPGPADKPARTSMPAR